MIEKHEDEIEEDELELYEHYRFIVDKGQSPIRVDKFLTDKVAFATRSRVQQAIDSGSIKVNGENTKGSYKIKPEDDIQVLFEKPRRDTEIVPENLDLDIIYEDQYLMVVNKPSGMVVHPAQGNWTGTLVNGLVYHFQNLPEMKGNEGRPGLVHRIDKDTSGLLVIAKSETAMTHLAAQFFHHTIERTYMALVWGELEGDSGTIRGNVGRSFKDRKVMDVFVDGSYGKHAITHWKVVEELRYISLIECKLETGRTHQIRAHMKFIGHPLFNDAIYGGDKIRKGTQFSKYKTFVHNCFDLIPRQALHAKSLGFIHPITKEKLYFEAPFPADFEAALNKWRNYVMYE